MANNKARQAALTESGYQAGLSGLDCIVPERVKRELDRGAWEQGWRAGHNERITGPRCSGCGKPFRGGLYCDDCTREAKAQIAAIGRCVDCGTQCVADADGASVLCPACDRKVEISHEEFGHGAWVELANATDLGLIDTDPQPFSATLAELETAIEALESKAAAVESGDYGDDDENEDVDVEGWTSDLRAAAAVLDRFAAQLDVPVTVSRRLLLRLVDLGVQDMYTDAEEYADRVSRMQDAVNDLAGALQQGAK